MTLILFANKVKVKERFAKEKAEWKSLWQNALKRLCE